MSEPDEKLWGGETDKAVDNFPVSGQPVPAPVVHWLSKIKAAAARTNAELGLLDADLAERIAEAGDAIGRGEHDSQFPIDVFQTGSGTSSNMNCNEVIANLAGEGAHPNDHVNMGQSSNDVFPSAVHLAALDRTVNDLLPALDDLAAALRDEGDRFGDHVEVLVRGGSQDLDDVEQPALAEDRDDRRLRGDELAQVGVVRRLAGPVAGRPERRQPGGLPAHGPGGGEELGGIRGVMHYMQRTAIQGSPQTLSVLGNRWIRGAEQKDPGVHPFRKTFEQLEIGDTLVTDSREVTLEDIEHFAEFTGDRFYAHTDEEAAAKNPFFEGRVAHGYLIVSFAAGLFVDPDFGPVLANYGVDDLRFAKPVNYGDSLKVRLTCKQKTLRAGSGYGEVRWDTEVTNQDDEVVAQYDVLTMVATDEQWASVQ